MGISNDGDAAVGSGTCDLGDASFPGLSLLEECDGGANWRLRTYRVSPWHKTGDTFRRPGAVFDVHQGKRRPDSRRNRGGLALEAVFGDRVTNRNLVTAVYGCLMRLADSCRACAAQRAQCWWRAPRPGGSGSHGISCSAPATIYGREAAAQFYCERGMARAAEPGAVIPNFFGFDHRIYAPISPRPPLWLRGFPETGARYRRKGRRRSGEPR